MKKTLLFALILSVLVSSVKGQDLPNPPANIQTLPTGSFIIAMDNTNQSTSGIGVAGKFNLKAYGLVVHLLNNNIKVKWVMAAGKIKDGIDFTVNSCAILPVYAAALNRDYKAAPFVIYAADTAGVRTLVNSYYTARGLTGNNRPNVYRTTVPASVDIRYTYLSGYKPIAAILTDGGNEKIHVDFMKAAGITVTNYTTLAAIDLTSCYTFASEPHNDKSGPIVDSTVANIKRFVVTGRNFLAECAAVRTYENNILGRFQTTTGIDDVNKNLGTTLTYTYADLSFYQFEGDYNASAGGSVKNWEPLDTIATTAFSDVTGSGANSITQAASVAKLVTGLGGLVYYLGNHDFNTGSEAGINGVRMYMNAFLTPAQPAAGCYFSALPVKLTSFQGNLNSSNKKITLQWTVADNEIAENFELQRSTNGTVFTLAALVISSEKTGSELYTYPDYMTTDKVFYRLKMTDKSGVVNYSKILTFQATTLNPGQIKILSNPVVDKLTLSFEASSNQPISARIVDMSGRVMQEKMLTSAKGINTASFPLPVNLTRGMYMVIISDGATQQSAKFLNE